MNGSKYRPLSDVARSILADIAKSPTPCLELNPGVVNRLVGEDLARVVWLPSPYKTHKGREIGFLEITQKGVDEVALHKLMRW